MKLLTLGRKRKHPLLGKVETTDCEPFERSIPVLKMSLVDNVGFTLWYMWSFVACTFVF